MFKINNHKVNKRKNTVNLKYQTLLEENLSKAEKIIDLQDKVIRLQEELDKYKKRTENLIENRKERRKSKYGRN